MTKKLSGQEAFDFIFAECRDNSPLSYDFINERVNAHTLGSLFRSEIISIDSDDNVVWHGEKPKQFESTQQVHNHYYQAPKSQFDVEIAEIHARQEIAIAQIEASIKEAEIKMRQAIDVSCHNHSIALEQLRQQGNREALQFGLQVFGIAAPLLAAGLGVPIFPPVIDVTKRI